ncbi:MAG: histidine phosphatase family protein [Alphaproteobacteria bacterium]|nr:histidine phosphatase family protein [Alphaproteobacteria bacterium]
MKIYMIRHCESEDDVLNCYGGCADFDLTKKGIDTAAKHSEKLSGLGIQKIYASPYKRAKNTALIFDKKVEGGGIEEVDNLCEINTYGVMSGVNKELARDIFGLLINSEEYKSYGYYHGKSFLGGEDVAAFDARVRQAFDHIVKSNNDIVAVVTHGGVFRSVYKNILKRPEKILEIDDAATIEIEYDNGNYTIANMSGIKLG